MPWRQGYKNKTKSIWFSSYLKQTNKNHSDLNDMKDRQVVSVPGPEVLKSDNQSERNRKNRLK